MNNRIKDLTGQRYGQLTVFEFYERKDYRTFWKCLCDCGKEKIIDACSLRTGHTRSCGCFFNRGNQIEYGLAAFNRLYHSYKVKAKDRNREFLLNKDDFRTITLQNCYYCGIEPKQIYRPRSNTGISNGPYVYNGIDRKENLKGYTLENCVACCGRCNRMKLQLSVEDFINQCIRVVEYNDKK
jgi:hypothetical protein